MVRLTEFLVCISIYKKEKMKILICFLFMLLSGCVGMYSMPLDFIYKEVPAGNYKIATWQKITDETKPIAIYIEGDGNSFNAEGLPTNDPTPRGDFLRDLASKDTSYNVVYMARPCQFIKTENCDVSDWTTGRFSQSVIDSMSSAVKQVAKDMPIILIGYSGGAMVSGLIIQQNPQLPILHWITIAGVLNHKDWTDYFGDTPLKDSLNLEALPDVPQTHYTVKEDSVVPNELSHKWIGENKIIEITNATHGDIKNLTIFD